MPQKAAALLAQENMCLEGKAVCAALSGGPDSVALVFALRELGCRVSAFHLNHCLRGAEADRDENFVRSLCARLDVPLIVRREDIAQYAAREKLGVEEAARRRRYALLDSACAELGCDFIATGHNADDNLETVLFHLVRGTGARGLAGIPPVRGKVVRPLLGCTRADLLGYLSGLGEGYVTDSTNLTGDNTRSYLRQEVLPGLRRLNPRAAEAVLRLGRQLRADEEALAQETEARLEAARDGAFWQADKFAPPYRRRMLRRVFEEAGAPMGEVGEKHIALLERLLDSPNPSAALSLPGGLTARRQYGRFCVSHGEKAVEPVPETRLSLPFSVELPSGRRARGEICKNPGLIHKKLNTFFVDCGTIDFETLTLRARRPGDSIRLHPAAGTKSLQDLMVERRIPRAERDGLAVFADRQGVVAAERLGADIRRAPCGGEVLLLCIEEL